MLSATQIAKDPSIHPYTDYQLMVIIRQLAEGYTVKQACKRVDKDGKRRMLPLYELKCLHTFHRKVLIPYMILEQTDPTVTIIDYVLTRLEYTLTIRFTYYLTLWLSGTHSLQANQIATIIKYVNKAFLVSEILRRRKKIAKWDVKAADVTVGSLARQAFRRLIVTELETIATLSKLLATYM